MHLTRCGQVSKAKGSPAGKAGSLASESPTLPSLQRSPLSFSLRGTTDGQRGNPASAAQLWRSSVKASLGPCCFLRVASKAALGSGELAAAEAADEGEERPSQENTPGSGQGGRWKAKPEIGYCVELPFLHANIRFVFVFVVVMVVVVVVVALAYFFPCLFASVDGYVVCVVLVLNLNILQLKFGDFFQQLTGCDSMV